MELCLKEHTLRKMLIFLQRPRKSKIPPVWLVIHQAGQKDAVARRPKFRGARRTLERTLSDEGRGQPSKCAFFTGLLPLKVSLFLAVYAAAVFLPVETGFPGRTLPLRPAFAEIPIVKFELIFSGDLLSDLANQIVFLVPAVEERCRKGPDPFSVRDHGRSLKSMRVTESTAVPLPLHQASQEVFQRVTFGNENLQTLICLVRPERIQSFLIFLVGMDIGVVEKTQEIDALLMQDARGIYRARRTTDVK